MGRREAEHNKRRAFAFLLAALLWAEGTFGSVCAAQEVMPENAVVSAPEDEEQAAIEEEKPESGEAEKPAEEEELTLEETDASAEGEELAPDGTDASAEGEEAAPEETDAPAVGEDLTTDETDKPAGVSVPENTPDQEELLPEQITEAGEALGEPPLQSDDGGASGALSYRENVMLTSGGAAALQKRDPADIIDYYKAHPWSLNVSNTYSDKPSAKSPYKAGHLSDESLNNALNLLNFIRYVAGIPADVTLNEDYIELTQAGALLNRVNGQLSHMPARPAGFTEEYNELYEKGYKGCSSSNIGWNYANMAQSLLNGWMYDGDSTNIALMGHRRWVLNPSMTQTGFGAVGAYSAMYVFDRKGSSITDYVVWPARNMPIELMNGSGTPWTVSLGSDYQTVDRGQITVTLKDVSSGKTWSFSEKKADGYFAVNTGVYGMPNCIIFRPNSVSYDKNSQFQMTVTGLRTTDGKVAALSCSVDFFSLSDTPKEVERVTMSTENLHLLLDDTEGKNRGMLHAALTPSDVTDKTVKWESLNEAVATVDQSGVVTAVGMGETTVMATAVNGKQAACAVRVSAYTLSADGITYDENTKKYCLNFDFQGERKKLEVKDGGKPTADAVRWTSENQNVAAVDADGTVTPVGVGEAAIWANVENGLKTLSCEVKVENAGLPAIELREKALELSVWKDDQGNVAGDSRQLRIYLSPADTKWKRVNWTSSDDSVAAVSGDGLSAVVTAKKPGNAEITAVLADENGAAATGGGETAKKCKVTVREAAVPENIPCLIALTNIQTSLYDVKLPDGWKWKYPDTALAPYKGMRSKTFPAEYQPVGETDRGRAEALLPVYFLTVENISLSVRHQEETGAEKEVSVLKDGWTAMCYVNYSFADDLTRYEENHEDLKNNDYYQNQKNKLLEELERAVTLTSSKPQTLSVGEKNADGGVALKAAAPGDTLLTASLDLGEKAFTASSKLTVVENTELSFAVFAVDRFAKSVADDYRYEAELSQFDTATANQINSGISLRMTGVTKLTVKSSNSKVVAVKASTVMPSDAAGGSFEIPLIVKAAGMAEITVTGNDAAKTSQTLTLVVADACPGLSEETVTVNTWRTVGTEFCLYPAKNAAGEVYKITSVTLLDDERSGNHSGKFILTGENTADDSLRNCRIAAKADTGTGTYKMKLRVAAGSGSYDLPFTVKVVAVKPKCSVKQKNKLNLFYKDTGSLLVFDTEEKVQEVSLTGCSYIVEQGTGEQADTYWLKPAVTGVTVNSVKKGNLKIMLEGWQELSVPFTVGVEKKPLKISPVTSTVTLYPKNGFNSARIGIKNPETLIWSDLTIAGISAKAKGNYEAKLQQEEQDILLQGKNLNQADSFRVTIRLKSENWTESVNLACNVKVDFGEPAIALEQKTLQLNANDVYRGYDAASTLVRWKNGGSVSADEASGVRVSVYCNARDAKAKELVKNSQVIFSVEKKNGCYQVKARLNNKAVAKGNYQYVVQASKDGKLWKTALTLKIVDTAPDKAVKIAAKGSIDVLNREGSFMTLTPSLKAVNGSFVIPADRTVKLTGRDAHLFRAVWSEDGRTIELRAKNKETLVIKNQYTVTPMLILQNVNGETEEITAPAVKFKVKQGSAKVTTSPKTALMYSGAYNSVAIDMNAVLKGADAPEIEKVTLVGNTDAFTYEYNKEGKGTLAMNRTGRAVKGKTYSLQFRVSFAEQADNVKPVTVRYTVKVK